MVNRPVHPSDVELVQLADDELSDAQRAVVGPHVDACARCRERTAQLGSALTAGVRAYHATDAPSLPGPEYQRIRLDAALREAASAPPAGLARAFGALGREWPLRWMAAGIAAVIVCGVVLATVRGSTWRS